MSVVRNVSRSVFLPLFCIQKTIKGIYSIVFFYPSPVSPKGREAVCLLAEKLIDKVLLYINKTFKRTLKKRTNYTQGLSRSGQTSPPLFRGRQRGSVISFPTDDYFCLPQIAQMNTDFSSGPLDYSSAEFKRIPLSTRIESGWIFL